MHVRVTDQGDAVETETRMRDDPRGPSELAQVDVAPRQVFRREGEYWTIEYAGIVSRLRDSMGLRHIACLLGRPGERVPATELISPRDAAAAHDAREVERNRVTVTRAIRAGLAANLICSINAGTFHSGTLCTPETSLTETCL